jgi:hypothetical protein
MYMLHRYHICPCFYNFSIRFWNCSDNVVFIFFIWSKVSYINIPLVHVKKMCSCGSDRSVVRFSDTKEFSNTSPMISSILQYWRGALDTTLYYTVCQCLRNVWGFLHQQNWPPRYNWNIVESDVQNR